jgi:putative sporulation protein YyaC
VADIVGVNRTSGGYQEKRVPYDAPDAVLELSAALKWLWRREGLPETVLCIGTDRSTGDALGPVVGSTLSQRRLGPIRVLGTLEDPVHAANLGDYIRSFPALLTTRVFAIDASLGRLPDVGMVTAALGPLKPGAGVNKQLPALGRYHLTGTVNVGGFMEFFVLQNTRLNVVMKMASCISEAFIQSLGLS